MAPGSRCSEGVPPPLAWNDVFTSYRSPMPWPLTASSASAPTIPHTDSSCFTCSLPCTPSTHLAHRQVPAPTLHAGLCSSLTPLRHNVTCTPSLYSPHTVFLFFLFNTWQSFFYMPHPHRVQQELLEGEGWFCFLTASSAPATALTQVSVNTSNQLNMRQSELWENTSGDLSLAFYVHYTEITSL